MHLRGFLVATAVLITSGSAQAVVKTYDSSPANGLAGDFITTATDICPPVQVSPDLLHGNTTLEDDGAGSVSLDTNIQLSTQIGLGPDQLTVTFGPGAFIFVDSRTTRVNNPAGGSVHASTGAGADTDPGGTVVWGIVSGWAYTGAQFCVSSPVATCNQNGFLHGTTISPKLTSGTFNLGTWAFDSVGDYETVVPYIERTANGGLQNTRYGMRGAFTGSALPALPLVGFGALALSLAVIGGRSLLGKK